MGGARGAASGSSNGIGATGDGGMAHGGGVSDGRVSTEGAEPAAHAETIAVNATTTRRLRLAMSARKSNSRTATAPSRHGGCWRIAQEVLMTKTTRVLALLGASVATGCAPDEAAPEASGNAEAVTKS